MGLWTRVRLPPIPLKETRALKKKITALYVAKVIYGAVIFMI